MKIRIWRWLVNSMAALGCLVILVTATPLVSWWATALAGPWNDPDGDVLIVLAGSRIDDDTMGLTSYWRSFYTLLFFKQGSFKRILISGEPAPAMRDYIVARGIYPDVIDLESKSISTRESAVMTADLLRRKASTYDGLRLVLLTSDYHMWRSQRVFQHAGVNTQPRPIGDALKRYNSPLQRWGIFLDLCVETTKIGYYWIKGWL